MCPGHPPHVAAGITEYTNSFHMPFERALKRQLMHLRLRAHFPDDGTKIVDVARFPIPPPNNRSKRPSCRHQRSYASKFRSYFTNPPPSTPPNGDEDPVSIRTVPAFPQAAGRIMRAIAQIFAPGDPLRIPTSRNA